MSVEYLLADEGIRQNFILHRRPSGTGELELTLDISTSLCAELESPTGLAFRSSDGYLRHAYRGLQVWDVCGAALNASMVLNANGDRLRIIVDDGNAVYPLTIDPVSTTFNRQLSPTFGGEFGFSVATAGDLNGDGYSDVVVAAPLASSPEINEGLVYVYYGSAAGIPAAASVILQIDQAGAQFGFSVDGAGDVNGDGFCDLIIGAPTWENDVNTDKEGGAFIFHGSAAGISTVPAVIMESNATNNYMGYSVAGLGDINGDGYSDVGTGGHLASIPQFNEGIAWIFLGSATGVNPVYRHRLERNQGAAQFGGSISGAGDVNGDGYNDVIIGAHKFELTPGCPNNTCDDGAIFIYHGSAAALGAGANPAPATIFNTAGYSRYTGWSVSTAGDVNGDGYSDVIVGDWRDNIGGEIAEGTAFIFHGSAAGVVPIPVTILQSNLPGAYMGRSVSTAGDVNGDGYADILVGAPSFANGQPLEGATFLHLGGPAGISSSAFIRFESNINGTQMGESVSTAGDVNGDGYSDIIVGLFKQAGGGGAQVFHGGTYNVSPIPSNTLASVVPAARAGWSVANAGDVNGDGYSDALIGAPNANNGQAGEGVVFVHHGSTNGLSAAANRTLEADIALAEFGKTVASAGDVNGDGYADVVIGAPSSGGIGRAYIFHGSPAGVSATPALVLNGTAGSNFGSAVFKAGDVNADGYSDVLIGAPGNNRVFLHLGSMTGLDPVAHAVIVGPVAGSNFGAAVGTAGDVNGDGYSDVIIGAPNASLGLPNEGAFYIYLGGEPNFPNVLQYQYYSGLANARLGISVAGAGDVNGDGFFDIIAGADQASMGQANEGIAYVFYGSSSGILGAGLTTLESNQAGANFGFSVAEAGDVNGDGYADVTVGAPFYSNGQVNEGGIWVFLGAPIGASMLPAAQTIVEVNAANIRLGFSVAGGGDVNGDGYSDVIGGAPYTPPAQDGTVHVFRGNEARSLDRLTRQYLADLINPVATNSTDFTNTVYFGIGHRARSPIQRTPARLRWEVVHEGQPFSGNPITNSVASTAMSAAWTNLGLPGTQIKELVYKVPGFNRYKWRVRVEYPLSKMIDGQRFSRWFYGYASAVGDIGILPIELLAFDGKAVDEGNLLNWTTGSEVANSHFLIERSMDGRIFGTIGNVGGAGHSSRAIDYEFMDHEAPEGLSYYRLRAVDIDGDDLVSPVITILRANNTFTIYPVPVEDVLHWNFNGGTASHVQIVDALGRTVVAIPIKSSQLSGRHVQQLTTGTYTLVLLNEGREVIARQRFLKR